MVWASSLLGFYPGGLKEMALKQDLVKADAEK